MKDLNGTTRGGGGIGPRGARDGIGGSYGAVGGSAMRLAIVIAPCSAFTVLRSRRGKDGIEVYEHTRRNCYISNDVVCGNSPLTKIASFYFNVTQLGSNRPLLRWSRGHFQPNSASGIVPNHD
jgi:hypothetical protein